MERSAKRLLRDSFSLRRPLISDSSVAGSEPDPKLVLVDRWDTNGEGGINKLPEECTSSVSDEE